MRLFLRVLKERNTRFLLFMTRPSPVYASGFFRLGAWVWDSFIISAIAALAGELFGLSLVSEAIFSYCLQMAYYTYFVAGKRQATPCGKIWGLKVADARTLGRPTLWQSYMRIASQVLLVVFIYKIGVPADSLTAENIKNLTPDERGAVIFSGIIVAAWYVPALFTKTHTCFHDIISGTRVINYRKSGL